MARPRGLKGAASTSTPAVGHIGRLDLELMADDSYALLVPVTPLPLLWPRENPELNPEKLNYDKTRTDRLKVCREALRPAGQSHKSDHDGLPGL